MKQFDWIVVGGGIAGISISEILANSYFLFMNFHKIISSLILSAKFFSSNQTEFHFLFMPNLKPIGLHFCPKLTPLLFFRNSYC